VFSVAIAIVLSFATAARAQLDPFSFSPIGSFSASSGSVVFNTDTLSVTGPGLSATGVNFNQPGGPSVAVFDFSSFSATGTATMSITGSRPFALLSRGGATIPNVTVSSSGPAFSVAGGYLGGVATSSDPANRVVAGTAGAGPGGGSFTGRGAGGGGFGGAGGAPAGGLSYGNLPLTLDGGSGGAATSDNGITNTGGAGGGGVEFVAAGVLNVNSIFANGSVGSSGSNGCAGGGGGGGIILIGSTLGISGTLSAAGGNGSGAPALANIGGGGGGGGRIFLGGSSYTYGSSFTTVNGGNMDPSANSGPGLAGVVTVDPLNTTIPAGSTVLVTGGLQTIIAGSTNQTEPTVEGYIRKNLIVNLGGAVILGNTNALRTISSIGDNITQLVVGGTFDLNGFNQAVDYLGTPGGLTGGLIKLPAVSTLTVGAGPSSSQYAGQFSGAGSLLKIGAGSLTFTAASPQYTGTTTIAAGTLAVGADAALANSSVVLTGGAVTFATTTPSFGALAGTGTLDLSGLTSLSVGGNGASTTFSGPLLGTGGLIKQGTGTMTLNANASFPGPVTVGNGTLTLAGQFAVGGSATINTGGTLTLTAQSAVNGGITVNDGGTLNVASDLALKNSTVTLNTSGKLAFLPGTVSPVFGGLSGDLALNLNTINSLSIGGNGSSTTVTGFVEGSASLQKTGAGTLTIGSSNFYSGSFTMNNGMLSLGVASALSGSVLLNSGTISVTNNAALQSATLSTTNGGTLAFAGAATDPAIAGLSGSGFVNVTGVSSLTVGGNGASSTFGGGVSGAFPIIKSGNGTLTLTGSGAFFGPLTISGGVVALGNDTALASSVVTLTSTGNLSFVAPALNPVLGGIAGPSGSFLTLNGINSLSLNGNNSTTFAGQLLGTADLIKNNGGTLTLSGPGGFTGPTTVALGTLAVGTNQTLASSTVSTTFGALAFVAPATDPVLGALGGSGIVSLAGVNSLTVGGNGASTTLTSNLIGPLVGGLTKQGAGTWTLAGNNTHGGQFNISAGTVLINSANGLSPNTAVTVQAGATLDINGFDETLAGNMLVAGNVRLGGGSLATTGGASVSLFGGRVANGFLHAGSFGLGGGTLSGITTFPSTLVVANLSQAGSTYTNFSNGGAFNVSFPNGTTTAKFDGFVNQGSGAITLALRTAVNVSDFQTYGTVTITPAALTQDFSQTTLLTNTGTTPISFNGGSRTFVGTPQTAVFPSDWPNVSQRGQPTFVAGIDLNGKNAVVAGGLFVNNGYVEDSSNGFQGTAAVVADFGSLVKGAGFFQNTVVTQNGGKFQAGNSPGAATFGKFVFGPGGVNNYVFAIDDATGTAGPQPDAQGRVSGWSLVDVIGPTLLGGGPNHLGDFTWTATPADKLTVSLETLVNPTIVGTDVPGPMDHFDPSRSYSWPAVEWTGSYSGPADGPSLAAATAFDAGGFANPVAGVFGWQLNAADGKLSLTYTPTAVPEPGTLSFLLVVTAPVIGLRILGCCRRAARPSKKSSR
jgi:autotransporter-associated beta strand protein